MRRRRGSPLRRPLRRELCGYCGRRITVTAGGYFYRHVVTTLRRYVSGRKVGAVPCAGSQRRPADTYQPRPV